AAFEQSVEGMEELLLRAFLLGKELDVVDQQRIYRTIEALEFIDRVELRRLDHVRYETLGMQVDHLRIGILLEQVITHGMHQVGLAQTNAAIQKERVIAVLGIVGVLPGRGAGQLVGFAFDKLLEGKGAVEIAGVLEPTFPLDVALGPDSGSRYGRS